MAKQTRHQSEQASVKTDSQPASSLSMRSFSEEPKLSTAIGEAQPDLMAKVEYDAFSISKIDVFDTGSEHKSPTATSFFQPKLTIGEPNDKYEQEADKVAAQVVEKINSSQPRRDDESVQRTAFLDGEQLSKSSPLKELSPLQRKSNISAGPASGDFESGLQQARSGGTAIEPQLRGKMESAMGADFSQVKIHTDAQSDNLSRSIQAKAFTTGSDVFFKQGEYSPGSRSGQELLAHELTHVVQQTGSVNRTIQRRPITLLDSKIVGSQFIGTSNTEDIQNSIKDYNKIESSADYDQRLKVLGQILSYTQYWLQKNGNKKPHKLPGIQGARSAALSEQRQVDSEKRQASTNAVDSHKNNTQVGAGFWQLSDSEFKGIYDPVYDNVKAQVLLKLGVGRGAWRRSAELNDFRQELKDAARAQANQDISDVISGASANSSDAAIQKLAGQGEGMQNYNKMKAETTAHSTAKTSVDAIMTDKAGKIADDCLKRDPYERNLNAAVSQATNALSLQFISKDPGLTQAKTVKSLEKAKLVAAKQESVRLSSLALEAAIADARDYTKGNKRQGTENTALVSNVKQQVTTDEIGKKAVIKVVEADTLTQGFDRVAALIDTFIPKRGSVSLDIVLKIKDPQTGGFFITQLTGEASKDEDKDAQGKATKEVSLNTELTLGGGWEGLGLSVSGQVGFYFDSTSTDTSKAVGLVSYGFYRKLQNENLSSSVANTVWGYGGKSALKDRGEEAETWATAMEEYLFTEDDEQGRKKLNEKSSVEVGALAKGNLAANLGGLAKGEFEAKGSVGKEYSADSMGLGLNDIGKKKQKNSQALKKASKGSTVASVQLSAAIEAWNEFAGGEFSLKLGGKGGKVTKFEVSAAGLLSNALGKGGDDYGKVMNGVTKGIAGFLTSGLASIRNVYNAYSASKDPDGQSRAAILGALSDVGTSTLTAADTLGAEWSKQLVVDGDYQDIVKSTKAEANMNPLLEFKDNLSAGFTISWEKGEGTDVKIHLNQVKAAKLDTGAGLNTVGSLKIEGKVTNELASVRFNVPGGNIRVV